MSAAGMQTIACIKWGTAFSPDYVNRLYRSAMRHVRRPTQFLLFCDEAAGLDRGIIVRPIPPFRLPATGMRGGPWRKLALWSPQLGVEGDVLFLDLDVVITGPLDSFFDFEPGKLCLIRNWTQANDGIGNSSVMRFRAGAAPHLFANFERDAVAMSFKCVNEQMYITKESGLPMAFWPRPWCPSFKHMLVPRFPANLWRQADLPADARVVIFTGHPRPHEARTGDWPAPWYKKHYKSIRPVRWIDEHWR
jgi:hypothetical protein